MAAVLDEILSDRLLRKELARAGWFEGYSYESGPWRDALVASGLGPHPLGEEIVKALGGLSIYPRRRWSRQFAPVGVEFGLVALEDEYDLELVPLWARQLGLQLCPIGLFGDEDHISIGSDGMFYVGAAIAGELRELGAAPVEMMRYVVLAKGKPVILEPEGDD